MVPKIIFTLLIIIPLVFSETWEYGYNLRAFGYNDNENYISFFNLYNQQLVTVASKRFSFTNTSTGATVNVNMATDNYKMDLINFNNPKPIYNLISRDTMTEGYQLTQLSPDPSDGCDLTWNQIYNNFYNSDILETDVQICRGTIDKLNRNFGRWFRLIYEYLQNPSVPVGNSLMQFVAPVMDINRPILSSRLWWGVQDFFNFSTVVVNSLAGTVDNRLMNQVGRSYRFVFIAIYRREVIELTKMVHGVPYVFPTLDQTILNKILDVALYYKRSPSDNVIMSYRELQFDDDGITYIVETAESYRYQVFTNTFWYYEKYNIFIITDRMYEYGIYVYGNNGIFQLVNYRTGYSLLFNVNSGTGLLTDTSSRQIINSYSNNDYIALTELIDYTNFMDLTQLEDLNNPNTFNSRSLFQDLYNNNPVDWQNIFAGKEGLQQRLNDNFADLLNNFNNTDSNSVVEYQIISLVGHVDYLRYGFTDVMNAFYNRSEGRFDASDTTGMFEEARKNDYEASAFRDTVARINSQ